MNGYTQYCKTESHVSWEIECKVNLTQMKPVYEDLFLVLFSNLFSPLSNDAYLGSFSQGWNMTVMISNSRKKK